MSVAMKFVRYLMLVLIVAVTAVSVDNTMTAAPTGNPIPLNAFYVDHPTDGEHIKRTHSLPVVQTHFNGVYARITFGALQLWQGPVLFGYNDAPIDTTMLMNGEHTLSATLYDANYNILATTTVDVTVQNARIGAMLSQNPQLSYPTADFVVEGESGDSLFVIMVSDQLVTPEYFPQWGLWLPLPFNGTGNLIFGMFPPGYTDGAFSVSTNLQANSQANLLHFVMIAYRDGAWHSTVNVSTARTP